jgi:hypothetical protein
MIACLLFPLSGRETRQLDWIDHHARKLAPQEGPLLGENLSVDGDEPVKSWLIIRRTSRIAPTHHGTIRDIDTLDR